MNPTGAPSDNDPSPSGSGHDSSTLAVADVAQRGIDYCRKGHWDKGLRCLHAAIANSESGSLHLPAGYYGFLGAALAKAKKYNEALEFCRVGVKKDFYLTESYLNLARVHLARGEQGLAYSAALRGLAIDEDDPQLKAFLRREFPHRKKPMVGFLKRSNPVNKALGRARHAVTGDSNDGN
jgi:tetratricopeptide (TPR) repeat protein